MGKVHQIGEEYYIEFFARGLLYQQKAGMDLKKAQELLNFIEEKIAKGELQAIAREIDIDIFFAEFLKHARKQYHPATVRRLRSTMDHFGGFIFADLPQIKNLSQITPRVVEDYKTYGIKKRKGIKGNLNPKIINLTLLLLREIFEYGIKTGFINDNPTLHVCLLEVESAVGRTVPDVQCASFFEKIEQPYRDILVLMRYTGLRLTEVLDLTWQQIDFNRNVIFIRSREVPLLPQALLVLKDLFNMIVDHKARVFNGASGSAIDPLELLRSFEQARLEDGLPITFSMIALRHFFVKDLFQRNISFLAIGKMLGVFDAAKLMVFASYIPLKRQDIVL